MASAHALPPAPSLRPADCRHQPGGAVPQLRAHPGQAEPRGEAAAGGRPRGAPTHLPHMFLSAFVCTYSVEAIDFFMTALRGFVLECLRMAASARGLHSAEQRLTLNLPCKRPGAGSLLQAQREDYHRGRGRRQLLHYQGGRGCGKLPTSASLVLLPLANLTPCTC